jgi:hypothetical protein
MNLFVSYMEYTDTCRFLQLFIDTYPIGAFPKSDYRVVNEDVDNSVDYKSDKYERDEYKPAFHSFVWKIKK